MQILLFKDDTVNIDLAGICEGINSLHVSVTCKVGKGKFAVPTRRVAYPSTYKSLPKPFRDEAESADRAICSTAVPYDNNFFFESSGGVSILSFFAWDMLTSLPMDNGLVYFMATFIAFDLPLAGVHERTTGCISDFLADKTGVDVGMRSAFVCPECLDAFDLASPPNDDKVLLSSLTRILDDLSKASRSNVSVVEFWKRAQRREGFDVFLCHNSVDKAEVRAIARLLRTLGLRPWLDEEQLRPGLPWQVALEEQISEIGAAAILVGASNFGPWQNVELRAFIDEFVRRSCPVIPVLLPNVSSPPDLPLFLRQMT